MTDSFVIRHSPLSGGTGVDQLRLDTARHRPTRPSMRGHNDKVDLSGVLLAMHSMTEQRIENISHRLEARAYHVSPLAISAKIVENHLEDF